MATTRGVIHAIFHASGMERPDDKDPLALSTYYPPATIQSMLELRAFCAAFFEVYVRKQFSPITDQDVLARFLKLICHSPLLFARARAVIPELQRRDAECELSKDNAIMRRVLQETEELRNRLCRGDEVKLIEESAWTRLANDGREQFERVVGDLAGAFTAGDSESWVPSCVPPSARNMDTKSLPASISDLTAEETTDINDQNNPPAKARPPKPAPGKKPLKLENIPLFIPSAQLGAARNVVWSPTNGSRPLKPGEVLENQTYEAGTHAAFGDEISGNVPRFAHAHTNLSYIKADTPVKRHGRGISTPTNEIQGSALSPRAPAGSPTAPPRGYGMPKYLARNSLDLGQLSGSAPDPTQGEHTTRSRLSMTELAAETAAISIIQENMNSPRPSFARMAGTTNAEAFYASPSRPFNSPLQGFHETSNPPTHDIHPPHAQSVMAVNPPYHSFSEPAHGPFRHQAYDYERSNAAFNPGYPKSRRGKQRQTSHQQYHHSPIGPLLYNARNFQAPQTPSPIDQWNDLYFQTLALLNTDAITTPLHPSVQSELTALHEARLSIIAIRLPNRGTMGPEEWIAVLREELNELRGKMKGKGKEKGREEEIIEARKRDYEEVLRREIALAAREV